MSKEEAATLAGRIKMGMANAGIHTPAELARRAKLHRQMIHKYLNGENEKLTPKKLFALADALKVNPRWLAFGPPESPVPPQVLDPDTVELVQIKATLDEAPDQAVRDARDSWLSHGRNLVRILTPKSENNPFPSGSSKGRKART